MSLTRDELRLVAPIIAQFEPSLTSSLERFASGAELGRNEADRLCEALLVHVALTSAGTPKGRRIEAVIDKINRVNLDP